jgi:putative ABC transport system permease protein
VLAIAIGVGAAWWEAWGKLLSPTIPLPEGDRLVLVQTRNTLTSQPELRVAHDFLAWRQDLRTIEELGAYRTGISNLIVAGAPPMAIRSAEMTPGAFRTARVAPVLGRGLQDADARPDAPAVVVLRYDLWQRSLGGRADIVGWIVGVGATRATVIDVMPEDFAYPANQQAWTRLQLRASYGPLEANH